MYFERGVSCTNSCLEQERSFWGQCGTRRTHQNNMLYYLWTHGHIDHKLPLLHALANAVMGIRVFSDVTCLPPKAGDSS